MSIQIKTIGKKKYAYLAYRRGNKVVQKYLGPAERENVVSKIEKLASEKKIPPSLQKLFWDTDPSTVSLKTNAVYIIERILETGNIEALEWLQRIYPAGTIIEVFETSRKISPKSKNFWKIWYGVANAS